MPSSTAFQTGANLTWHHSFMQITAIRCPLVEQGCLNHPPICPSNSQLVF